MPNNPSIEILLPNALSDLEIQAFYVWLVTVSKSLIKRRPLERRNQRHADLLRDKREFLSLRLQVWQDETNNSLLKNELNRLDTFLQEKNHHQWEVAVTDGQQFDVNSITMSLRPFLVDLHAFEPLAWDNENTSMLELEGLLGIMGAIPKTRIQIIGLADKPEDHSLAAFMAADILEQYGSYAKIALRPFFHTLRGEAEWTFQDSRNLAASLAGNSHEIAFGRRESSKPYHLLDANALRSWANHPRFFLHQAL